MAAKFLTVDEFASALRISDRTARNMIYREQLPAVRIGKQWRIPATVLDRYGVQVDDVLGADDR